MSIYKRRRTRERPMSLYTGGSSPVLLSYHNELIPQSHSVSAALTDITNTTSPVGASDTTNLDSTLTNCDQSNTFEQYDLEIAELQHSPTCPGKKVWTFSTPDNSPGSSRRSDNSSDPPSPDVTPIASKEDSVRKEDSIPPSPASSVSSTLQQLANRLRSHSISALDNSGSDRRYMVISEMIDTERKYVNSLEVLLNIYLPALEHMVAPRDLRLLFPAQLEPLLERHNNLLTKLEERMSENTLFPGIVGDIFARLLKETNTDFLNMYSAYMNEFKVAMTTMVKYETASAQFRELLLLCQHSPSCEGLGLASYLLTPIQRLPRYELLLKELLRQTSLDHPDNFYVSDAIDLLHQELNRLNQSIRSCQLACSVRRVTARKASFRVKTERAIARLKRHVSTANIDEYSSGDSSTGQEVTRARVLRRRRGTLKPSPYRSEENLLDMDDEEGRIARPLRVKSMMSMRPASSLSDLAVSFDADDTTKRKSVMLTPLESLPATPEPSPRPTSPSECSINPMTSEESSRTRSRLSVYSTASSTSGIGSIDQFDLRLGPLTPTQATSNPNLTSTPVSSRVTFRTGSPVGVARALDMEGGANVKERRNSKALKRRLSWTSAFKMLSWKKNGHSYSASKVLDIGSPKNFRHIQHGFPPLPEGVSPLPDSTESNPQLCKSNASSNNTLNAVHL